MSEILIYKLNSIYLRERFYKFRIFDLSVQSQDCCGRQRASRVLTSGTTLAYRCYRNSQRKTDNGFEFLIVELCKFLAPKNKFFTVPFHQVYRQTRWCCLRHRVLRVLASQTPFKITLLHQKRIFARWCNLETIYSPRHCLIEFSYIDCPSTIQR